MIDAPIPADDDYRLAALKALPLLDTPPEPEFDTIVQLGQHLFDVPTCLITLVDRDRQWFKARVGLDVAQTSRKVSFCGHAILNSSVLVVPDAAKDERFHDNPLVLGPPYIRFYAGAPIMLPSGYPIGTVCILGPEPNHAFSAEDARRLASLAQLALNAISVLALRRELDRARMDGERHQLALLALATPVALLDAAGRLTFYNDAFAALCPGDPGEGTPLLAALGLAGDLWSPAAMRESGAELAALPVPALATGLTIYRTIGGFCVAAPQI